jgi:hypothetical protein
MVDCHHKRCCDCDQLATVVAEVAGTDGVHRFDLCEAHYVLIVQEAARKGVMVMVSPFDAEA